MPKSLPYILDNLTLGTLKVFLFLCEEREAKMVYTGFAKNRSGMTDQLVNGIGTKEIHTYLVGRRR